MTKYSTHNKRQTDQTAAPSKYPQGWFKDKPCRHCGTMFSPRGPSNLYCSQDCADDAWADNYLQKTYGIDWKHYVSMLEKQNHKCAICGSEGFTMKEGHRMKLVVDHCHTTGRVRGLLCHNCNRALGLFQDNIESINRAIDYLKV